MKTQTSFLKWFFLSLLIYGPAPIFGDSTGKTAAQFLKIGVGARAMGMGGAFTAVAGDAHSLYWNPAGVAKLDRAQLASSVNLLYQDTQQGFIGYAHPIRHGVLGGGINYLQVSDIEKRSGDTAAADSTTDAQDSAAFFSFARPNVWRELSLGINAKVVQMTLDTKTAQSYALDLGTHYQFQRLPISWGASIVNLGTKAKFQDVSDPLPLGIKTGVTYRLGSSFLLSAGGDYWIHEKLTYGQAGVEWTPLSSLALRTGPQMGGSRQDLGDFVGLGAGFGVKLRSWHMDYAYVPFGDLGDTHRLSMRISF